MVLRLSRKIGADRRIDLGYGVAVYVRAFGFAEFKEVEAAALRRARETLPDRPAMQLDSIDDEDMPEEVEDAVRGRFATLLVQMLLMRVGTGWEGLEDADGAPAPFDAGHIAAFLDQFPGAGQVLQQGLVSPAAEVASEGKGSAPSHDTGTPAA